MFIESLLTNIIDLLASIFEYIKPNFIDIIQTIAIVATLYFTGRQFKKDMEDRRCTNVYNAVQSHRELWFKQSDDRRLSRIFKTNIDLKKHPVTEYEKTFVTMVILHMYAFYETYKFGTYPMEDGDKKDIKNFLSYPISNDVWNIVKIYQSKDFVEFIESL